MNKHHVVTTINSPTAITCASKGNFLQADEDNLMLCKGSSVEVYSILHSDIKLITEFSIYGVISKMQVFDIPDRTTCSLFLLTDQNYFTILTYSNRTSTIVTEHHGQLEATNARITDQPLSIIVDSHTHTILISAFTGFLFAIPYQKSDIKGKSKESPVRPRFQPTAIRTNEFDFLSMVSLNGIQQSSFAVLLGETNELKTIKSYKYVASNEMVENEKALVKVESTTHTLIAVPDPIGGVLSIGEYIIAYHDLTTSGIPVKELSIDPAVVTAYTFLDNSFQMCVIGDQEGYLYMLSLDITNMRVNGISSTTIGRVCQPNQIVDLGNQLLYISSCQGDPCIVRLSAKATVGKYKIDVLHTYSNLGPIVDFCLFDYDQQGKQTMVCCSGVDKDGSLRIVENGDGFVEHATLPIPLVKNFWTIPNPPNKTIDTLLISTMKESFLLKLIDTTLVKEIRHYSALKFNEPTITTGITRKGYLLQVIASGVRMMTCQEQGAIVSKWKPPQGQRIAIAKMNATQCVICYGRGVLVYLDCADDALKEKCIKEYTDIACINLSPRQENGIDRDYVLIGMWTQPTVMVLGLPNLEPILEYALQRDMGAKDVLIIRLEKVYYFMILLGDGQVLTFVIQYKDNGNVLILRNQRKTMVGTYCTGMHPYVHQGQQKVFISGTRPTIMSSVSNALYFSAVNIKNIYSFSPMNNQIVLLTRDGLLFGHIDTNQKLHHTKITLDQDMPIRIQYMSLSKSLAVGTVSIEKNNNNGFITRKGKIQILDAQTFQVLCKYGLPNNELVESMAIATFKEYPDQEYLFIGTVIENIEDPDSSHGRILVFHVKQDCQIEFIEAIELPGIIYALKSFQNSVVACVNGSIYCLSKFRPDVTMGERVEFDLNVHKNVLALTLDTRGDRVLVGDLMRSISILSVTQKEPLKLDLLALDSKPNWMTAVKFINDNVYMGADDRSNIFTVSFDEHHGTCMYKLELQGGFHVGSLVNCFRSDTVYNTKDKDIMTQSIEAPFSFATVHGSIGTIKTITSESFELFHQVEQSILKERQNIGHLNYHSWRNYKSTIQPNESIENNTFIDGDILGLYLTMSQQDKRKVLNNNESLYKYNVQEMERLIRNLISW